MKDLKFESSSSKMRSLDGKISDIKEEKYLNCAKDLQRWLGSAQAPKNSFFFSTNLSMIYSLHRLLAIKSWNQWNISGAIVFTDL
jgi:hypothetical protein